jgi:hypothetical protein
MFGVMTRQNRVRERERADGLTGRPAGLPAFNELPTYR